MSWSRQAWSNQAVEVRSEGDYGPLAEEKVAEKRADYFAAGTPWWCGMWTF